MSTEQGRQSSGHGGKGRGYWRGGKGRQGQGAAQEHKDSTSSTSNSCNSEQHTHLIEVRHRKEQPPALQQRALHLQPLLLQRRQLGAQTELAVRTAQRLKVFSSSSSCCSCSRRRHADRHDERLELLASLLVVDVLDRTGVAVSRVVHQPVQFQAVHQVGTRFRVGDVEQRGLDFQAGCCGGAAQHSKTVISAAMRSRH